MCVGARVSARVYARPYICALIGFYNMKPQVSDAESTSPEVRTPVFLFLPCAKELFNSSSITTDLGL